MKRILTGLSILAALPVAAIAQGTGPTTVRSELMEHFEMSMRKVVALAAAMPADAYVWKPEANAMPVGQVYAHIARYNFYYLANSMGTPVPAGIRLDSLEAMRDKAQIVALLQRSMDHVRRSVAAMPADQMDRQTKLYGRSVPHWAVLVQLVAHMNEHLGQSIAYARSNKVVPPWSG